MTLKEAKEIILDEIESCEVDDSDLYRGNVAGLRYALSVLSQVDDNYWHTGEPTEVGWYLILYGNGYPDVLSFNEVKHIYKQLTAWHKIPPYKEQI